MTDAKSPHLDPDWMRQKYLVEGLSSVEIAKIVHRHPKRIYEKLREFGIPTRPRGYLLKADGNRLRRAGVENPFFGRKHTVRTRALLSVKATGRPGMVGSANGMFGVHGPAHPSWKGGITPERQRLYHTPEWRFVAHTVYRRDYMRCRRCGRDLRTGPKPHIHHVVSFARTGVRLDPANLVLLCRECHWWVHSKQNVRGEFLGGGDAPVWGEKFRPDSSR
ncbi:MAG: HNH endonuclease [Thermoplasmata archaeon]